MAYISSSINLIFLNYVFYCFAEGYLRSLFRPNNHKLYRTKGYQFNGVINNTLQKIQPHPVLTWATLLQCFG